MLKTEETKEKSLLTKKRSSSIEIETKFNKISQNNHPRRLSKNQNDKSNFQISKQKNIKIKTSEYIEEPADTKIQKNIKKKKLQQPRLICQFYQNGACHKGSECTFSHDVAQNKKKRDLCKYFLTGNCFKGNNCIFSHDTREFPCKFFHAVGYCDKGDTCK